MTKQPPEPVPEPSHIRKHDRCTFIDEAGARCPNTKGLKLVQGKTLCPQHTRFADVIA